MSENSQNKPHAIVRPAVKNSIKFATWAIIPDFTFLEVSDFMLSAINLLARLYPIKGSYSGPEVVAYCKLSASCHWFLFSDGDMRPFFISWLPQASRRRCAKTPSYVPWGCYIPDIVEIISLRLRALITQQFLPIISSYKTMVIPGAEIV